MKQHVILLHDSIGRLGSAERFCWSHLKLSLSLQVLVGQTTSFPCWSPRCQLSAGPLHVVFRIHLRRPSSFIVWVCAERPTVKITTSLQPWALKLTRTTPPTFCRLKQDPRPAQTQGAGRWNPPLESRRRRTPWPHLCRSTQVRIRVNLQIW